MKPTLNQKEMEIQRDEKSQIVEYEYYMNIISHGVSAGGLVV